MQDAWISVKVHPHAGKEVLVSLGPGRFEAWVKAKPVEGQANEAVSALLARTLRLPKGRLKLVKGGLGRRKVFRVIGGIPLTS
jgi:uncharacterized protein YggU (UPF0235/DUF167 family)